MQVNDIDSYSSFLLEVHISNNNKFTNGFDIFMSFPTLRVLIRLWAVISTLIILSVKLDVNWFRDNL